VGKLVRAARNDHHAGAGRSQQQRRLAADSAATAGNQCDASVHDADDVTRGGERSG